MVNLRLCVQHRILAALVYIAARLEQAARRSGCCDISGVISSGSGDLGAVCLAWRTISWRMAMTAAAMYVQSGSTQRQHLWRATGVALAVTPIGGQA